MPDSMDVALRGTQLLVANGASGLAVIDASGTTLEQWPLLGRGGIGSVLGEQYATRLLPTPTGAWVFSNLHLGQRAAGAVPCPSGVEHYPAAGNGGRLELFDTRNPTDPVLRGAVSPRRAAGAGAVWRHGGGGRLLVAMGNHAGVIYCEDPLFPPPPWASLTSGRRTMFLGLDPRRLSRPRSRRS